MSFTCRGCLNATASSAGFLQCLNCRGCYHNSCLNIEDDHYNALTQSYKESWICPSCSNVTCRRLNKANTPVCQRQIPMGDSSMNMSFDIPDDSNVSVSCPDGSITQSNEVTMEKISTLFDEKMKAYLSSFMNSFRMALKEDVAKMVRSEMGGVVQEFKNDLNAATDFLASQQETLKSQIAKKDATIKILEADCERMHADLHRLTARMSAMEKTTRSYNVEIQAVPETRNENVTLLFKKICDIVNLPIEDSSILACRRVAKMDSTSKRARNILVTLASPRLKDTLLSAVQRYNKAHPKDTLNSRHLGVSVQSEKIYVVEHLSPECKQLFAAARKFARDNQFKYVWAKYGRVYLRKDDKSGSIYIKNHDTLENL
ncbi:hypothetical protein ABMA28_000097 [Loxostege sticticalis]|uniref:PHD-type domain-containing protein n=1 Tax=Loxostege sticticalis TaxID=481309 RepID=A0ABD0TR06_LOXSC